MIYKGNEKNLSYHMKRFEKPKDKYFSMNGQEIHMKPEERIRYECLEEFFKEFYGKKYEEGR